MWDTLKEYIKSFFNSRLVPVTVLYVLLFLVLINRLFQLQIVEGEEYANQAQENATKTRVIKATRGNIYDCNGKLLAYNKLSYNVTFTETDATGVLTSQQKNVMISNTIKIIENNGDSLSVENNMGLDKKGRPVFMVDGNTLLRFKAEIYSTTVRELTQEQKDATAQEIYDYVNSDETDSPKFCIDNEKYDAKTAMKIFNVRYAMFINRYKKYQSITLATDVDAKTVAAIKENSEEIPGVDIIEDTIRVYKRSKFFAHIIGYTGGISSEKLEEIKAQNGESEYTVDDQIGISGLENVYEDYLKGDKGSEKLTINSRTSRVIEVSDRVDPVAGNDLYLTIDADLQEECYKLLEEHIAGILVSVINNGTDVGSKGVSATNIKIPIYDVYNALIQNNLVNVSRFRDKGASSLEKETYRKFKAKSKYIMGEMRKLLASDSKKTEKDISEDMQEFLEYFYTALKNEGIVISSQIDTSDAVYKKYAAGKLSLSSYLQYAISENWVDLGKLNIGNDYFSTEELYSKLVDYGFELLSEDIKYIKMVYSYLIYHYELSGKDCCILMFDQGNIKYNAKEYESLQNGTLSAYSFIINKIKKLEITPGQLGLEPCSGSVVITDVKTGKIRAMVTYPSYDNNKMANKVDAEYYNTYLTQSTASPLLNRPTQQALAPGSTFKLLSSIAGLEEGVITPSTTIYDKVVFDKIDHPAKCWSSTSHGNLNVSTALENSCNYFYYTVGYMLSGKTSTGNINYQQGINRLKKYGELLGLTEKSGVEIYETAPHFADGDAVRAAIGQDTHAYTPSQLSRYLTSVANGGKTYDITLVDKVKDVNGKVVLSNKAKVRNKVNVSQSTWDAVHKGMYLVVNGPSSSIKFMYNDLKVTVAGKTGTAQQNKSHPNHAYFVSYAPYEEPEIDVTCVIPNGYTSSNAAQTARDIYKYYFSNKKDKSKSRKKVSGSIKMPESSTTHID